MVVKYGGLPWYHSVQKVTQLNKNPSYGWFRLGFFTPDGLAAFSPAKTPYRTASSAPASFHQLQGLLVAMELVPSGEQGTNISHQTGKEIYRFKKCRQGIC